MSNKNWLLTFILCLFWGALGLHSFYVGRIGRGIAQILTFGGLGIWVIIDLIIIVCGTFKDSDGNEIPVNL
jgi:TM2 domain-containing membrane protein YozV